jgi:hypothetical protein
MLRFALPSLLLFLSLPAIGCGSSRCQVTALNVSPGSAALDHTSAPPANQQSFLALANNNGCLGPGGGTQGATDATWSSSDPTDVPIVKTPNRAGLATCVNQVSGPVTITATTAISGRTVTGRATVTCQ